MLVIDHNKKIYEQLYEQIKKQILSGELKPGTRLQATRGLAQEYGISRNSVVAAYEQLLVEGYVRTVIGSGYYVEKIEIPYQPDKKPNSNTFETSKKMLNRNIILDTVISNIIAIKIENGVNVL